MRPRHIISGVLLQLVLVSVASAAPTVFVPNWKVGESRQYVHTTTNAVVEDATLIKSGSARTRIGVTVVATDEGSTVVEWKPIERSTSGMPALGEFVKDALTGLGLMLQLNAAGDLTEVTNWPEIRTRWRERRDDIIERQLRLGGGAASAVAALEEINSIEQLREMGLAGPRQFLLGHGIEMRLGAPHRIDSLVPNPLGGDNLPAVTTYTLDAIDEEHGLATISITQALQQPEAQENLDRAFAESTGVDAASFLFERTTTATILLEVDTGWVHSLRSRTTSAQRNLVFINEDVMTRAHDAAAPPPSYLLDLRGPEASRGRSHVVRGTYVTDNRLRVDGGERYHKRQRVAVNGPLRVETSPDGRRVRSVFCTADRIEPPAGRRIEGVPRRGDRGHRHPRRRRVHVHARRRRCGTISPARCRRCSSGSIRSISASCPTSGVCRIRGPSARCGTSMRRRARRCSCATDLPIAAVEGVEGQVHFVSIEESDLGPCFVLKCTITGQITPRSGDSILPGIVFGRGVIRFSWDVRLPLDETMPVRRRETRFQTLLIGRQQRPARGTKGDVSLSYEVRGTHVLQPASDS